MVDYIGTFIMDGSLEVRNCSKATLLSLSINVIDKNRIRNILIRSKDESTVNKILSSID